MIFLILITFIPARTNLGPTMLCLSYGVLGFCFFVYAITVVMLLTNGYVETRKDGIIYCEHYICDKKLIPYSSIRKIYVLEFNKNKINKIVTESDEIYINSNIRNVQDFISEMNKYVIRIKE